MYKPAGELVNFKVEPNFALARISLGLGYWQITGYKLQIERYKLQRNW